MDKRIFRRLLVGKFSMQRLMTSAIIIYAMVGLWAFFFSDRLIFLPPPSSYSDNGQFLRLTSAEGVKIAAIHLPNPTARYTILYSHGNAEDLGRILPRLERLRDIGFAVFAYDYRGYGLSQGTPTVEGAYQDIDAAYNYLRQELAVPPEQIIVYGRSVGSGPSVDLASREPVGGLAIESGFVTIFRVAIPIPIYPFDKFPNIDKISDVDCPVLIMHGTADGVIPFSHGERLFGRASTAHPQKALSLWVDGAGHNDFLEVAGDRYPQVLKDFVKLLD